jgi:hypothetical protein
MEHKVQQLDDDFPWLYDQLSGGNHLQYKEIIVIKPLLLFSLIELCEFLIKLFGLLFGLFYREHVSIPLFTISIGLIASFW